MSAQSTVKDVARQANVSVATVSRVINGTYPVSDRLKLRVMSAVTALQYAPNTIAAQLSRNGGNPKRRSTREVQDKAQNGQYRLEQGTKDRTSRSVEALKMENKRLKRLLNKVRAELQKCGEMVNSL